MKPSLVDVYPRKAQFLRGEILAFVIEVHNPFPDPIHISLNVEVRNLLEREEKLLLEIELSKTGVQDINITLPGKEVEFQGYGLEVELWYEDELAGDFSSAFDVVDNYRRATRYGFLADFAPEEKNDREDVKNLARLHLNLVQFYDWMYRHDTLLPPSDEYRDPMGKYRSLSTVMAKIALCHDYGMKAVAYGAVYAASEEFFAAHPDWALYDARETAITFIDRFYIMNVSPDCPWHGHIIDEFRKAIEAMGFDGIHMDTYGFPKTALYRLESGGELVKLDDQFPLLIDSARRELTKVKGDVFLVFNNVCNWPVEKVANAGQDAIYIEVWEPYDRYGQLGEMIRWAKYLGQGKPVILGAYLAPFRKDDLRHSGAAMSCLLFLTAVIASQGAYHLILGENRGVLTQGYYVDYERLTEDEFRTVRSYYDFLVRYCTLLYDPELKDVSMTHAGGDNQEYRFADFDYSMYCRPGRVWCIIREKPGLKIVSHINFCGIHDDRWNEGQEEPVALFNLTITIQLLESVKSVFIASPDTDSGKPQPIDYKTVQGPRGKYIQVKIPELRRWSLLAVRTTS